MMMNLLAPIVITMEPVVARLLPQAHAACCWLAVAALLGWSLREALREPA